MTDDEIALREQTLVDALVGILTSSLLDPEDGCNILGRVVAEWVFWCHDDPATTEEMLVSVNQMIGITLKHDGRLQTPAFIDALYVKETPHA